jgi:hypothetical protein
MDTLEHAKIELELLVRTNTDPDNRPIIEEFIPEILALIKKFGESGQSGGSAPYVASALSSSIKKLCLHENILPITGDDSEWVSIKEEMGNNNDLYQNKRFSAIFKENGKSHFIDAIIFENDKGQAYHGAAILPNGNILRSSQNIKSFPFDPKTFYVKVREVEVKKDDWEFYIDDIEQLNPIKEYYDYREIIKGE